MRTLLLSVVFVACLAAGANAHSGMLALFSDTENHECHMALGVYQTGNLHLMYVRGDGPRMGQSCEFKLLKSTTGAAVLPPTWRANIINTLGQLETGISLLGADCFEDQSYVPLGTIPIMNFADPDTFTVKVVPDPAMHPPIAVVILKCDHFGTMYVVSGGTFIFNGACHTPEDPFGTLAVKETTWGAIKELYR